MTRRLVDGNGTGGDDMGDILGKELLLALFGENVSPR